MAHGLIVGISGTGKSSLAKWLARALKSTPGFYVAVLDKLRDPDWCGHLVTHDPDVYWRQIIKVARPLKKKIALIYEESRLSKARDDEALSLAAAAGRHPGIKLWPIAQRLAHVHPDVRENVAERWIFRIESDDAVAMAKGLRLDALREAADLPNLHFFRIRAGQPLQRGHLTFDGPTTSVHIRAV